MATISFPKRNIDPHGPHFVQEGFTALGNTWRSTLSSQPEDFCPALNTINLQKEQRVYRSYKRMVDHELNVEMRAAMKRGLNLSKEKANCQAGIRNSTPYRPNLDYTIEYEGHKFSCGYRLNKNSPFNGRRYLGQDGKVHMVTGSVTSSLNRAAPGMTLVRRHVMKNARGQMESVCYAGRPDTQDKFKELATTVFLGERESGKGITYNPETNSYELNFAMNSFISTFSLLGPESALVEKEYEELQKFNGSTITIEDENGNEYQVKVNIAFFSRQFNFMNSFEKEIPEGISGERRSREMSDTTRDLYEMIPQLKRNDPQIQKLLRILDNNEKTHLLSSEEEIFTRMYLCELAGIPLVIHCRSCVDRTSIGVAIAYALKQWMAMEQPIPNPPYQLLDNEDFKELWLANIPPGLLMTMYSRTVPGFKWQPGPLPYITQHPTVLRLMPKRYLTAFHLGNPDLNLISKENFSSFKKTILALFLWLPISIMRSPIKTFTHWILAPDLPHICKLWGIVRLIGAIILLGLGLVTLAAAFVLGTIFGFFFMLFGMWREIGLIEKDSTLGKSGDVGGIFLGLKLIKSLLIDLPPPQVLKDGIKLNGGHSLIFNGKGQA